MTNQPFSFVVASRITLNKSSLSYLQWLVPVRALCGGEYDYLAGHYLFRQAYDAGMTPLQAHRAATAWSHPKSLATH